MKKTKGSIFSPSVIISTAVLKVPARDVCGYDPCNTESCADNPNARCLVTSKCRTVFVNAFDERIRKCEGRKHGVIYCRMHICINCSPICWYTK